MLKRELADLPVHKAESGALSYSYLSYNSPRCPIFQLHDALGPCSHYIPRKLVAAGNVSVGCGGII